MISARCTYDGGHFSDRYNGAMLTVLGQQGERVQVAPRSRFT